MTQSKNLLVACFALLMVSVQGCGSGSVDNNTEGDEDILLYHDGDVDTNNGLLPDGDTLESTEPDGDDESKADGDIIDYDYTDSERIETDIVDSDSDDGDMDGDQEGLEFDLEQETESDLQEEAEGEIEGEIEDDDCGNETCDPGENCETCLLDCFCQDGYSCRSAECIDSGELCDESTSFIEFDREEYDGDDVKAYFKNLCTSTYIVVSIEKFLSDEDVEIVDGLTHAFEYMSGPEFREMITTKTDWTYTDEPYDQIYPVIVDYFNEDQAFPVIAYKTTWPWSSVLGYTQDGEIYLNTRKSWDTSGYGTTVSHELMHIIGFSHGSNTFAEDKRDSVPYFVGYSVGDYIDSQLN